MALSDHGEGRLLITLRKCRNVNIRSLVCHVFGCRGTANRGFEGPTVGIQYRDSIFRYENITLGTEGVYFYNSKKLTLAARIAVYPAPLSTSLGLAIEMTFYT